ncbi:hypothetical protein FACS189456_6930 [Bacteroidia bacterium]|nr:hypothetical protein FACS189456_6930 [Bacteroidia bacterium]
MAPPLTAVANTVFTVDTATLNKHHLFTFDYHGVFPIPTANDTLNPGDTLRIYYRTQILKSGTYRSAPTVQMYYDRTGNGYDVLDSLLQLTNNATYVSDTAHIRYDYHSKLKISKSLDSVLYRGRGIALSGGEMRGKFMKGDTLVYKIKLERASGGDSVQHTTHILVWDTLINQHQPIGKKYGKFVKTVPSSAIRNDSVLNWNISVLPKGKKSDSLWVYVALNDNNSTTTAFSDSSVLQQKIKLVRSNETVFKDSVFDTVRIFSLYDLRIKKLAGNKLSGVPKIINDTLYPATTNGDTVRYTLRVINKGRKSRISNLMISDTMQAGLRLLDTLRRGVAGAKVKPQNKAPFPSPGVATDTIYKWTIDTVSIPIGDSVEFVYDAIPVFPQEGGVLKNVAAIINHSKLNGHPAVNAHPDLAVDSVKVDFRFDADSLNAVILMQRGTLQSGSIVATTSRSGYYTAYDGDTIIMEVQVNNRYKKENRIATDVKVRAHLDTAYMCFLSDVNTGLQASQDSTITIAAPLRKGESDTVYFYAIAKKTTTVGTTDSAYVWCNETTETNKMGSVACRINYRSIIAHIHHSVVLSCDACNPVLTSLKKHI